MTKSQRHELFNELSLEKNRRYAERIKTILLIDSGESLKDIACLLFLDEGPVRN